MNYPRISLAGSILLQTMSGALSQPTPGTPLWFYDTGQLIVSSPALATDGTVYFGTGYTLYAITNAGSIASNKWTFATSGFQGASPCVASDGTVYCAGGMLYAVNPNGTEKWHFPVSAGNGSPAVALDGSVYFMGAYARLYALSADGNLEWTNRIGGGSGVGSPCIGLDGTIYAPSPEAGAVFALSSGGTLKWQHPIAVNESAAIAGDGTIYLSRNNSVAKAVTVREPLMGNDKLISSHTGSGSPNRDRLH